MKANFENAFKYKLIYVMRIEDEAHQGLVKIGDATIETDLPIDQLSSNCEELKKSALERIKNFTNTAGITTCLLHSEIAVRTVKQGNQCILAGFRDYDVHEILERSGFKSVRVGDSTGREWYRVDLETAKLAIAACKKNQASLGNTAVITKFKPIIFRPEQKDCINKVVRHFKRASRFLMNAKMRFGKTLVSLEIVKKSGFSKTIILTHRPVVNEGWYEDFKKYFLIVLTISTAQKLEAKNYPHFCRLKKIRLLCIDSGFKRVNTGWRKVQEEFSNLRYDLGLRDC